MFALEEWAGPEGERRSRSLSSLDDGAQRTAFFSQSGKRFTGCQQTKMKAPNDQNRMRKRSCVVRDVLKLGALRGARPVSRGGSRSNTTSLPDCVGGKPDAHRKRRPSLSGRQIEPGGAVSLLQEASGCVSACHERRCKADRVPC